MLLPRKPNYLSINRRGSPRLYVSSADRHNRLWHLFMLASLGIGAPGPSVELTQCGPSRPATSGEGCGEALIASAWKLKRYGAPVIDNLVVRRNLK